MEAKYLMNIEYCCNEERDVKKNVCNGGNKNLMANLIHKPNFNPKDKFDLLPGL